MPIVLDDVESDDDVSEVNLSDIRADSICQDVDSFSLELAPTVLQTDLPSFMRLMSKRRQQRPKIATDL
jgi:hypothetical protein